MSNVIRLRGKPSCAPASTASPPSSVISAETVDYATKIRAVERSRLQVMLSLLDMNFVNIRNLNALVADPNVRAVLEAELATLEDALSDARARALKL